MVNGDYVQAVKKNADKEALRAALNPLVKMNKELRDEDEASKAAEDWARVERVHESGDEPWAAFWLGVIALCLFWFIVGLLVGRGSLVGKAHAGEVEYTDQQIVSAIYWAEGGKRAKKPFGVLSVECSGYEECRRVCERTVKNNRKRFEDYGNKTHSNFLEFLASRYAPVGAKNDPRGLNRNWLKNVLHFLDQK